MPYSNRLLFLMTALGISLLLISCSDEESGKSRGESHDKPLEVSQEVSTHLSSKDSALSLWDSLMKPLEPSIQEHIQVWTCDTNEAPVTKLQDIFLNTQGDTLAIRELDSYGNIQTFRLRGTQGREYRWGEGIDSIHWVSPELGKAYQADIKLWHEERQFDSTHFKLSELKRFATPQKPLIWEQYTYNSQGQLILLLDKVSGESVHYKYSEDLLVKEWTSTQGESILDIIDYEYFEEDHLKKGLDAQGRVILEESTDDRDRLISIEEWDARGQRHCQLYQYQDNSSVQD